MKNKHTAIDRKTRTLGTKVSDEVYNDFQHFAARLNCSESQLLRLIINKFLERPVIQQRPWLMANTTHRKGSKRTLGAKVSSSVYEKLHEFSLSYSISAGALLRLLVIHFLGNQLGITNSTPFRSGKSYSHHPLNFHASVGKEFSYISFVNRLKKPAKMTAIQKICFRHIESSTISMLVGHFLGVMGLLMTSEIRKNG